MRRPEVALAVALLLVPGTAGALLDTSFVAESIRDAWGDVHEGLWDPSLYAATDVIEASGIDFVHAGFRDDRLSFYESTAGGACWGDYDRDGNLDLYVTDTIDGAGRGLSRLYRNMGPDASWTFADVTNQQNVGLRAVAQGCAWGDYDNDGWSDLYVTALPTEYSPQRNVLYRNLGHGRGFEDVTARAGVDGRATGDPENACIATTVLPGLGQSVRCWSVAAAWIDHDLDGDLDLYVTNYVEFGIGACVLLHPANPSFCQGQPNRLYRNNGDGTFTDVARQAGVAFNGQGTYGRSLGVIASDIDGDAWPDLYVANDQDANALYLNNRDGTFRSMAPLKGVDNWGTTVKGAEVHRAGMGVEAQDFSNDGRVDLLSTHFRYEDDAVYLNVGDHWEEVGRELGIGDHVAWDRSRWGGGFVDLNMDGWRDYVVVAGGVIKGRPGPIHLYLNNGTGFERQHEPLWPYVKNHRANHRAAAFADYDNDGDWDVYVSTLQDADGVEGRPKLLRFGPADGQGAIPNHHWLRLHLQGTDSPLDAFGAKVTVTTDGGFTQHAWKTSGGSYVSGSDPRLLVSLRNATQGTVTVTWPGGTVQGPVPFALNGERGADLSLTEPSRRAPHPPAHLEAEPSDDEVVLKWSPTLVTDFAQYRVWRSDTDAFADARPVAEVADAAAPHAIVDGVTEGRAWFWVTTVDATELESAPSPAAVVGEEPAPFLSRVPSPGATFAILALCAAAAVVARRR